MAPTAAEGPLISVSYIRCNTRCLLSLPRGVCKEIEWNIFK